MTTYLGNGSGPGYQFQALSSTDKYANLLKYRDHRTKNTLPHRNSKYVDAAYCYRPSSVVCLSVCHTSEPYKNGRTDRDVIWVADSGWPKEPRIRWVQIPLTTGNFWGRSGPL